MKAHSNHIFALSNRLVYLTVFVTSTAQVEGFLVHFEIMKPQALSEVHVNS